ncbi:hypothetical protein [Nocardia gamkensis]|uniref:hypothetical protein n=1 Tax=Nocardia gamkensis TaxID=352869 RepID=UPI0037C6B2B7
MTETLLSGRAAVGTGAVQMDLRDPAAWKGRLAKGTDPELATRLTQASSSMEQVITPLQWVSTAKPVAAKAIRHCGRSLRRSSVSYHDLIKDILTRTCPA